MKRFLTILLTAITTLPLLAQGGIEFNEIMPANVDMFIDPTWNYGSWVEFYNPTDEDVNLGGCYLSDDAAQLRMARIPQSVGLVPAHGFRTLWFGHKETRKDVGEKWENTNIDMKLDQEGGTLYLSNSEGQELMHLTYPAAIMRCSYARRNNTGDTWKWTHQPTPGATNVGSTFPTNQTQLDVPVADHKGQLFEGSLTVCVTVPLGCSMAYTTNGTAPTTMNGRVVINTSTTKDFTKKFTFKETTTLRMRLYSKKNEYLPSRVVTHSYILKDRDYYLPIISIVSDSLGLYGDSIGIYVDGKNGKTANQDGTKRNFNMEWDRPASFEFMDNGTGVNEDGGYFCQEVDVAINGGWSRKYQPRSYKVKASKLYDLKNSLDYPFFDDKPFHKHKSLLLRNGGNDEYNQTRLKDAALQQVARKSKFPLNLQSYRPCHVFINGKYLGMLNMREPSNKNYGYSNYGYDTDEMDAFEMSVDSGYVQKAGTKDAFMEWHSLAKNAADDMVYEQICDLVDIDDYCNYMAFKFFLNDWDWPHNNAKGFRSRKDGKFHMVVYDLDNCVDRTGNNIFKDFAGKQTHTFYSRPEYNWSSLTKEVELVTIFLGMLQNEKFKRKFIDTYCIVGGTVFADEAEIADIVNGMADNISTALSWEGHSPYGWGRSFASGIINAMTGSFRTNMMNAMRNYSTFQLSNKEMVEASISSDVDEAQILYNGIPLPKGRFDGYLFGPVTLTAKAPAGYRFAGWQAEGETKNITPVFTEGSSWRYYQSGSLDNTGWMNTNYNDGAWSQGNAPLGYGNWGKPMANATTTLSKTNAQGSRIPTYYVRKTFHLDSEPTDDESFTLNYSVDDGMIAYVNGQEVGLYHMWSGASYNQTCQSTGNNWYEGDDPYSGSIDIDRSLLHKGDNVVAIEVHNCNDTSSDIWIEASLSKTSTNREDADFASTDSCYTLPESGSINVVARFKELSADEMADGNITPIRINEVCANNSSCVNDYYKKDDWVELYNTTSEDIDLAGMYLTDKKSVPHKYQIPALEGDATIIPAHGFKVIWCSKRDQQGSQLHANFKLDNEDGKMVRIEAADGSWADSLIYCRHKNTESVGRYTDGSNEVYLMTQPSIAAANILNSYAEQWIAPEDTTTDEPATRIQNVASSPYVMAFTGSQLRISSQKNASATLCIYTPAGARVAYRQLTLAKGSHMVALTALPRGLYMATLRDNEGNNTTIKFRK